MTDTNELKPTNSRYRDLALSILGYALPISPGGYLASDQDKVTKIIAEIFSRDYEIEELKILSKEKNNQITKLEKKVAAYREVACNLVSDFKKFSSRQHELLVEGQTLDSASKNWESYPEVFNMQSIDFRPLIKLVEADRILKENND